MIEKGIYRHYKKGDEYEVIGEGPHTETGEILVTYKALYGSKEEREILHHRPKEMFEEKVETKNGLIKRFEKVER